MLQELTSGEIDQISGGITGAEWGLFAIGAASLALGIASGGIGFAALAGVEWAASTAGVATAGALGAASAGLGAADLGAIVLVRPD